MPSVHTARRSDRLVESLDRAAHKLNDDAGFLRWAHQAQKCQLDSKERSLLDGHF